MNQEDKEKIIREAEKSLIAEFEHVDKICDFNQEKVLDAFRKNKIGEEHFYTVTGYGHDDIGREALDNVYKDVFKAEAAIVRPHFVSGTHTLACPLFGILRAGDTLLSVTGTPYDTMQKVIGINEKTPESLRGHGVNYKEIDFTKEGDINLEEIEKQVDETIKMVLIQRSRGYSLRKSLSVSEIETIVKAVKSKNPNCVCFVDNCYGEFVEEKEPIEVGADLIGGSLIKNPGGGIVEAGGYIAGKKELVNLCAARLTAPGIYSQGGAMFNQTRTILQGFFMAPLIVSQAVKGVILCAKVFENMGLKTTPSSAAKRADLIQTIEFKNPENQSEFCKAIQMFSPVDSYLTPIPDDVPGYDDKLIMAGGTFIEGSTIELSADGPVRPPYAVYIQGGLSYSHVKIVLKNVLDKIKCN